MNAPSDPSTQLFYDIENIAFSHAKCNYEAGTKTFVSNCKNEIREEAGLYYIRQNYELCQGAFTIQMEQLPGLFVRTHTAFGLLLFHENSEKLFASYICRRK